MIGPLIPFYIFLFVLFLLDLDGSLVLVSIVYLTVWLVFFLIVLMNVYEVMVVYKDRIVFINPYKEKVIPLAGIRMIYYNVNRGLSFNLVNNKVVKMGFKFNYEKHLLEELFRRFSNFIDFSEEHVPESNVYCLVNKRIRG
jgi:hypothetical protein